jgi:hypothetical protein
MHSPNQGQRDIISATTLQTNRLSSKIAAWHKDVLVKINNMRKQLKALATWNSMENPEAPRFIPRKLQR